MRPRQLASTRISFALTSAIATLLATPCAIAASRWWGGGSSNIAGNGDGVAAVSASANGTWSTSIANWDQGSGLSHVAWVNSQNDTAIFNGGTNTINLGSDITLGGITQTGGGSGISINASASNFKITLGNTGNNTFAIFTGTTSRAATINAEIAGVSGNNLNFTGGNLTLNGVNTFAGNISLATSGATSGNLTIGGAGSLGSGNYAGTISVISTRAFNYNSSANQTLGGNIANAGTITKGTSASSVLILDGTNTGAGVIAVNAGTLTFLKTAARSSTGTVTVAAGATLGLGVGGAGFFTTSNVDSLFAGTLSGVANDATSNVGIDTTQGDFTYATSVAGAPNRGLVKLGANSLILTGTNTYAGATQVNAGKLVVEGSIAPSAVTVSGSGTILSTDTSAAIGNSLLIQSGAILSVGDAGNAATATATVTNATTFNNGSIFSWDINAAGTGYDKLVTTDVLGEVAPGNALFRIVAADAAFADAFWDTDRTWTDIFTTDGSSPISGWAGVFGSTVSVVNSSFTTITPVDGSFSLSGSTLTWTAVPEPTSALAGVLLASGLLRRRRQG